MIKNKGISTLLEGLFSAVFALSLYLLLFVPARYLLTDVFYLRLPSRFSLFFLIICLFIANVINLIRLRHKLLVAVAFFMLSVVASGLVRSQEKMKMYSPKIYSLSPHRVIQAEKIVIEGVNFGPVFKKGSVFVGEFKLTIKDWGENKIIAEMPVPSEFGKLTLKVHTKSGEVSNGRIIEVVNPSSLNN